MASDAEGDTKLQRSVLEAAVTKAGFQVAALDLCWDTVRTEPDPVEALHHWLRTHEAEVSALRVDQSALAREQARAWLSQQGYEADSVLSHCWTLVRNDLDPVESLRRWVAKNEGLLTAYQIGGTGINTLRSIVDDQKQLVDATLRRRRQQDDLRFASIVSVLNEYLSLLAYWFETNFAAPIMSAAGKCFETYVTALFVAFVPSRARDKDSLTLHDKLLVLSPRMEADPRFRMRVADLNELRTTRNRSQHDARAMGTPAEQRTQLASMLLKLHQFMHYAEVVLDEGVPPELISMTVPSGESTTGKRRKPLLRDAPASVKQWNQQKQYGHVTVDPAYGAQAGTPL